MFARQCDSDAACFVMAGAYPDAVARLAFIVRVEDGAARQRLGPGVAAATRCSRRPATALARPWTGPWASRTPNGLWRAGGAYPLK